MPHLQSVLGGQPLLIIGVAEPIVLIYGFVYNFCKHTPGLGTSLFLPWAGWVCVWTSLMCLLLALSGACAGIGGSCRVGSAVVGCTAADLCGQGLSGDAASCLPVSKAVGAGSCNATQA